MTHRTDGYQGADDSGKNAEKSYSLETDSGKADMVTGKVVLNMQWSGDGVYTMDEAEKDGLELSYAVPEEGSNLWFDGFCMMKTEFPVMPRRNRRRRLLSIIFHGRTM